MGTVRTTIGLLAGLLLAGLLVSPISARAQAQPQAVSTPAAVASGADRIGSGDVLSVQVFGQPDMSATNVLVADDGTIQVPLVGAVQVANLSPADAGARVAKALRDGRIMKKPVVTVSVTQPLSQRITVLGEVGEPGRYAIDSRTTIFDLLAEAGGVRPTGAQRIFILRTDAGGQTVRIPVDLEALLSRPETQPPVKLRAGDSVHVPRAEQFFVYGEVNSPAGYPMESGITVLEAIARAGGLTTRGSDRRIEIRRQDADGQYTTVKAKPSDPVLPNDVIRVKERIF